MKKLLFVLIPFLVSCSNASVAQVADTVYVTSVTDSTYKVIRKITFPSGATDTKTTAVLDSATTVLFLTNQIHDNELKKVPSIQNILTTSKLDNLYVPINAALNTVSSQGYLPTIWPFVENEYRFVWEIQDGIDTIYAGVTAGRQIVQVTDASKCDESPAPEPGGASGAFWGLTRKSFLVKNFVPSANDFRFVVDESNPNVFRSPDTAVVFRKNFCE